MTAAVGGVIDKSAGLMTKRFTLKFAPTWSKSFLVA
jgi:hypothetical protein